MPGFQFVAVLAALLFTGAAIYVNLVEHPARMEGGTLLAATLFGPSYRQAAVMQVILALAATVGGVGAWFMGAPRGWLVAAVVIFAVVPFTLIAILPTNKKLLDPALDRGSLAAHLLLMHWGRLYAVRSVLATCGVGDIFVVAGLAVIPQRYRELDRRRLRTRGGGSKSPSCPFRGMNGSFFAFESFQPIGPSKSWL